jgi:hypothetical protein
MRIYLAGDFFGRCADTRLERTVLNAVLKDAGHCNILVSYYYCYQPPKMQSLIKAMNTHNGDPNDSVPKKSKIRRKSS